jgi:site-specific recombinase XerD
VPVRIEKIKAGNRLRENYVITDRNGVEHRFRKVQGVYPHIRRSTKGRYWTGRWVADFVRHGKRNTFYCDYFEDALNTVFQSHDAAELDELELAERKKEGLTVRNAVAEYLDHCKHKEGYSDGTMLYKKRILGEFVREFAKQKLNKLTSKDILNFLNSKADPKLPSRFNRYRREVNALYNHAIAEWPEIDRNPVDKKIKKKGRKKSRHSYIPTTEELNRVIEFARKQGQEAGKWQDYNLIVCYRDTWARADEVLKWEWARHINWDTKEVRLVSGKASYERADVWYPMSPDVEKALRWQWEKRIGDKFVFQCRAVWTKNKRNGKNRRIYGGRLKDGARIIYDLCVKAGVKPFRPHSIRHNRISQALENGKDIIAVRDAARHASIAQTNKYSHSRKKLEETLW